MSWFLVLSFFFLCVWFPGVWRRYIITSKDAARSSSACSSSDHSAISQRSTPAASSRRSDTGLNEYATYYKSWKELATSKTEQDAARMLLLSSMLEPSSRSRLGGGDKGPARSSVEKNAAGDAKAKAASIAKHRRQQHLEKIKRAWRISDYGANVHNELSTEDFLRRDAGPSTRGSSSAVRTCNPQSLAGRACCQLFTFQVLTAL
jgi:hypothetical protein